MFEAAGDDGRKWKEPIDMKQRFMLATALLLFSHVSHAKESKELDRAFEDYQKGPPGRVKSTVSPGNTLSALLKKDECTVEETLEVLAIVRDSPSKDLIPQLKDLWKRHQKNTFRVLFPKDWRYVKAKDYSQNVCDEIKRLIKSMGGSTDELETSVQKP